jgi:NAD-dependent SIR2 family protein deacetylase
MKTFMKDPEVVWRWHYDFVDLMRKCKPNAGHFAIQVFIEFSKKLKKKKVECMLVTQNIDNYHTDAIEKGLIK